MVLGHGGIETDLGYGIEESSRDNITGFEACCTGGRCINYEGVDGMTKRPTAVHSIT
jgi:hypothetical protein